MSIFQLRLTKRVLIVTILLTILPMIIMVVLIPLGIIKQGKYQKQKLLYAISDMLDYRLSQSFNQILINKGAVNRDAKEQVIVLNQALQPIVDSISRSFPDIGMGYYSIELDSIVAVAPFNKGMITGISHTKYPYFNIYKTGKPEFGEFNNSLAWNGKPIVWYAQPIVKDGKIIGHVWANVKTDDVYDEALRNVTFIIVAWLLLIVIIVGISYMNSKRLQNTLNKFAKDFIADENIQTNLLPELSPIFIAFRDYSQGLIANNIKLLNEVERRKKIEDELQTIKERLLFLLSNSPTIFFSSKFSGDYGATFVSENVKTIFGYEPYQFINIPNFFIDRIHPDDKKVLSEVTQLSSKGSATLEFRFLHADGTYRWTQDKIKLITDKHGLPLEVVGCWFDVTEKKETEKELSRLERLNLIGQMAAGIGHEVRNPMTTVRGFLQVLDTKKECSNYKEYFKLMIEELDRANSIITDFLSLAKTKPSNLQVRDLNKIIDDLFPLLQADAFSSNNNISFEGLPIPEILIDHNEIHQLILNLVRNGLESMTNDGQVTIKTYLNGEEVVLAIKDEGAGIDPRMLDKLGTPFLTTKDQGTGLGLATCFSIAERNNARIEVDSSSTGTIFYVKFKIGNVLNEFRETI